MVIMEIAPVKKVVQIQIQIQISHPAKMKSAVMNWVAVGLKVIGKIIIFVAQKERQYVLRMVTVSVCRMDILRIAVGRAV